jgi:hypothetical protein
MALTYDPIQTVTLGSAIASITFSSIPDTYTDLRFVALLNTSAGGGVFRLRFNGDFGSNYSYTEGYTAGSTITVGNYSANGVPFNESFGNSTAQPNFLTADIMNYSGATRKTTLTRFAMDLNGSGFTYHTINSWQNTAVINSLTFLTDTGNFSVGSVFTVYGIKAA